MPKIVINKKYQDNKDVCKLMSRLPSAFTNGEGELLYDKRNKLRRFTLTDGTVVVVKKYKRPNLFQKICYSTFWKNKARKSFLFAGFLLGINVDTPYPIAYVTYKKYGFVSEYYLATTEVQGTESHIPMREMNANNDTKGMQELATPIVKLLIHLHKNGFLHGDSNLSNFICRKTEDGYDLSVIDINRSRILKRPARYKESIRNLRRTSHIHSILTMLARLYAQNRGWDEDKVTDDVIFELKRFERQKTRSKRLKKMLTFSFLRS